MVENTLAVKVFRYDPSMDKNVRYDSYSVPKKERMLVGDVLEYIYENLDGSLAYRWECRSQQCGGCTIMINGKPGLICKELAKNEMVLEPLPFLPLVRDLVIDREPIMKKIYSIPSLTRSSPPKEHPEPIDPEKSKDTRVLQQCVQCLACVAVCPATEILTAKLFPGPAELLRIARFATDERDSGERAKDSEKARLYDCAFCYACQSVCPHEIPITDKVITQLRNKCLQKEIGTGSKYIKAFERSVRQKGKISAAALLIETRGLGSAAANLCQGIKILRKGKLVSPFVKAIPKIEEIRTLFKIEKEDE